MSHMKKAPWQNPYPFSFMHPVERASHRGKPSSSTVSAPLVYWPVRSQSLRAARASSPSISIKRVSPLQRPTALQRMCFASPRAQNQNLQRSNSEEREKMGNTSWRYLGRTAGLMWCSSALAPSLASKWQSTYAAPLPDSPLKRSTDVVLGTFAHSDGDRGREGDACRNGNSQHFPSALSRCSARSGHPGLLPLRKYIPRSAGPPRFGHITEP